MYIPTTTLTTQQAAGIDGWTDDSANPWTYISATSFSTLGDRTVVFSKGTRLKLTQTTVKYLVVTSSSFGGGLTTVNVTGGDDFSLANAAVSVNNYSYQANPQGYPGYFNYTPEWIGAVTNPAIGNGTLSGKFAIDGLTMCFRGLIVIGSTTTLGSGQYSIGIPVPTDQDTFGNGYGYDSSSTNGMLVGIILATTTRFTMLYPSTYGGPLTGFSSANPWAWATGDVMSWHGTVSI